MRKAIAIAIVVAAAAAAGCARDREEDGGPAVERDFQVGGFERIEVAGPYEVEVRTGSAPSVHASGPQKEVERLVVEVRGDRLLIHSRKQRGMFSWGGSHDGVRIAVTVPQLRGATIAGSGDIKVDRAAGPSFKGEIAGSGSLQLAAVEAESVELAIAGSGDIRAAGKARSVRYEIAGSGDIEAAGLVAETAKVSIAGSGNVTAHATANADVETVGSGDVAVTGGAKCNVSKHGSGDVRCS